jgi:phosphatidylinositol alpha-mannosyltransferase
VILLEAMAAGTPIVASEIPAFAAVARHNREALLVRPGDAGELAAGVNRLLADADLGRRLAEAGSARADALSMDRLAERYLELYATIAG